jgi:WD40 repeat protein
VASACSDATQYGRWARVWHTASGQPLTPPLRHSDGVLVVEFSPDGRRVITGSEDATARIWDIERGAPLGAPLRHDGMVVWAAFSPDGLRAATASMDGSVGVWDTETCELIGPRLLHRAVVQYVAFGAGGETLLTLATDSKIRLWDVSAAKEPVDDLVRDAERLASHKLGPGGVVVPLDVESLRRVWEGQ